jgi:hypothetical protein
MARRFEEIYLRFNSNRLVYNGVGVKTDPSQITLRVTVSIDNGCMELTFEQTKTLKIYILELAKAYFISGFINELINVDIPNSMLLGYRLYSLTMSLILLYLSLQLSVSKKERNES